MMQNTSWLVERTLTFIKVNCQYKSKDIIQIFIENIVKFIVNINLKKTKCRFLLQIKIRQKDSACTSLVINDIMS